MFSTLTKITFKERPFDSDDAGVALIVGTKL